MTKNYFKYLCAIGTLLMLLSCSEDDSYTLIEPEPESPVVFDLASMPYQTLSEYNFFEGDLRDLNPVYGVIPYTLNSTLFTDYAKKKRFVWMPKDVSASYVNDYSLLDYPVGTILIKNFYYDHVQPDNSTMIIETRLMIRFENGWDFANYVWNEEQTEAYFTNQGSVVSFSWVDNGQSKSVDYQIPRRAECFTCHNRLDVPMPIGMKPQNLNLSYPYADGGMNQLSKLIEMGYLNNNLPSTIVSTVNWKDESQPLELRVRSYFDINCAHCHSDNGYCDYAHMRFGFDKTEDITQIGACVEHDFFLGDNITHIVAPGAPSASALFFRLSSNEDEFKMPLIGRTMVHEEGVALIEEWINTLQINCN